MTASPADNTNHDQAGNYTGVDSQLDALISRIHSLGNGVKAPETAQSAPASVTPSTPPVPPQSRPQVPPAGGKPQRPVAAGGPPARPRPPAGQGGGKPSARSPQQPGVRPRQPVKPSPAPQMPSPSPVSASPSQPVAGLPLGFTPGREEPWRPAEPEDLHDANINETLLESLVTRYLLSTGECEGRRVADQLQLPFRLVEPMLTRLKSDQHVAYKSSTATNDYVYMLTETGRNLAKSRAADCTYYGACPIQLKEYIASVKAQSIEGQYPKRKDLMEAFSDLLINPRMLDKLGPAVASGRGMFLYGFPGNGKTSIAERVTGAFGKYVWIPRAIEIDGEIMRVFDPMNHVIKMPEESGGLLNIGGFDKRWVRIERPTIVAGGELTMDMLEVMGNTETNISEAPLQLKSNCGTLVIDDFGRQKMSVDALLNRWIVPLEKRYDYLNMSGGKKIQVPFDQLVVFSTNLEPKDLVDDAFLRRIPYKIEAENPCEKDFRQLFEIMCKVTKVPYDKSCIDYLIQQHYLAVDRPMRMCQPRDLLLQVKNYCLFNDFEITLKNEYMDFACENYFSVM